MKLPALRILIFSVRARSADTSSRTTNWQTTCPHCLFRPLRLALSQVDARSASPQTSSSFTSPLLALPGEIQNIIYEYALTTEYGVSLLPGNRDRPRQFFVRTPNDGLSLLRQNRSRVVSTSLDSHAAGYNTRLPGLRLSSTKSLSLVNLRSQALHSCSVSFLRDVQTRRLHGSKMSHSATTMIWKVSGWSRRLI